MRSFRLGMAMALLGMSLSFGAIAQQSNADQAFKPTHECPESGIMGPLGHECPERN